MSKEKVSYYQRRKEQARKEAIRASISEDPYALDVEAVDRFRELAKRYGLVEEFTENGII